jgi:hypothetical protein
MLHYLFFYRANDQTLFDVLGCPRKNKRHEAQNAVPRLTPVIHETLCRRLSAISAHYTEIILPAKSRNVKQKCANTPIPPPFSLTSQSPHAKMMQDAGVVKLGSEGSAAGGR